MDKLSHVTKVTVGAADRNILMMATVVSAPAIVTTVEKVSLSTSTHYIIQPDLSSSLTISVAQKLSNVPD